MKNLQARHVHTGYRECFGARDAWRKESIYRFPNAFSKRDSAYEMLNRLHSAKQIAHIDAHDYGHGWEPVVILARKIKN